MAATACCFIVILIGVSVSLAKMRGKERIGLSGNIASLLTPTTTQSTGAATGSLFAGSILPSIDNQFDLGKSDARWRNLSIAGSITSIASSSFSGDLTVSGRLQASSTFQSSGLATLYRGLDFPTANGTLSLLNIAMSSASSSLNTRGASSSLDIANNSSTTLRVVGQSATSTIFASTTAAGFGSRLIFVTTAGNSCVQLYVSGTPAIGATVSANWEGVACPANLTQ